MIDALANSDRSASFSIFLYREGTIHQIFSCSFRTKKDDPMDFSFSVDSLAMMNTYGKLPHFFYSGGTLISNDCGYRKIDGRIYWLSITPSTTLSQCEVIHPPPIDEKLDTFHSHFTIVDPNIRLTGKLQPSSPPMAEYYYRPYHSPLAFVVIRIEEQQLSMRIDNRLRFNISIDGHIWRSLS